MNRGALAQRPTARPGAPAGAAISPAGGAPPSSARRLCCAALHASSFCQTASLVLCSSWRCSAAVVFSLPAPPLHCPPLPDPSALAGSRAVGSPLRKSTLRSYNDDPGLKVSPVRLRPVRPSCLPPRDLAPHSAAPGASVGGQPALHWLCDLPARAWKALLFCQEVRGGCSLSRWERLQRLPLLMAG